MNDHSATNSDNPRPRASRTDRDRKFLAEYFSNGMVVGKAEKAVCPTLDDRRATDRGSKRLARIRKTMEWNDMLAACGLDDLSLIKKAHELLNAEQVILDSDGQEHIVIDNRTRLGAWQTVGKWKGKEKNITQIETGPLEIKVTHETEGI